MVEAERIVVVGPSVLFCAVDDVGNFFVEIKLDVVALGDLRHDVERDADVLTVDRVENLSGQSGVGRRRADEGQILADDNHCFFIVGREQRRRGEHVGVCIGFKRRDERDIAGRLKFPVVVAWCGTGAPGGGAEPRQKSYR